MDPVHEGVHVPGPQGSAGMVHGPGDHVLFHFRDFYISAVEKTNSTETSFRF